ncbi:MULTISPECIES: hypothetical protein [unclassified Rhodococcus (in: high G+C Gram-positive bacteria)]|nr:MULTISPECIES: hypothetical protein [unclassified Rhodococcus (in: high G+C Gram-positive bacteria)]
MTSTLGLGDPIEKMPIVGRSAGTTHVVVEETKWPSGTVGR